MGLKRSSIGEITIIPVFHKYALHPDIEKMRAFLKKYDVIFVEDPRYVGKISHFLDTLKLNLSSYFGTKTKFYGVGWKGFDEDLAEAIRGIKKRIVIERGLGINEKIDKNTLEEVKKARKLLAGAVREHISKLNPEEKRKIAEKLFLFQDLFTNIFFRTKYDVKEILKHVKKGKKVAVIRGELHTPFLLYELRKHGINCKIQPLAAGPFHEKGTPFLDSSGFCFALLSGKRSKETIAKEFLMHFSRDFMEKEILEHFPGLKKYPNILFRVSEYLQTAGIKKLTEDTIGFLENYRFKDVVAGKEIKLKELRKK